MILITQAANLQTIIEFSKYLSKKESRGRDTVTA